MKTTVVCGLLGSGKTTFIRHFLRDRTEKAVVLVNDFGQTGIDGEIISAGGIEAVELPSGCVCCTLKFDLIRTVQKVMRQFNPDHVMIEPSGVASPFGVLEALECAGLPPPTVVGIVDAVEFSELYEAGIYGNFLREQIECSDVMLVNKVDIAKARAIAAAERLIIEINPRAVLFRTLNATIDEPLPEGERKYKQGERIFTQEAHCQFETLSFRLNGGAHKEKLWQLFEDLAKGTFGTIARAKALLQADEGPWRFDISYGKIDESRFEKYISEGRLVVIGRDLAGEEIEKRVKSL
jgi:G3E family GTPase